jgi:hypothetical protein
MITLSSASILAFFGALPLYLTSRNQCLLQKSLSLRWAAPSCLMLECVALLALMTCRSPATSVFILVMILMITWSLVPLLIALILRPQRTP